MLRFLQGLAQEDNYRYILLDLRFDKEYVTDVDSLLFDQIHNMRNIVVAHHEGDAWDSYELASEQLRDKIGLSDYKQFANFTGMYVTHSCMKRVPRWHWRCMMIWRIAVKRP
ncbi:MAG: hypothetical protein CW341_11880 [Bacteroidetes bacterium]|nr:hypothetical protein [Bacteroidota bacterium]